MLEAMEPRFFATADAFGAWLAANHTRRGELWVGFYKRHTERPSMTWPESVDEALCYGWIDGIRKRLDDASYVIRFTPRKPDSAWSAVNLRNMERLLAAGRVQPAGLEEWKKRSRKKSGYSYEERRAARFEDGQRECFEAQAAAWEYFNNQAPWYRRTATHWVVSAKREATRKRRLDQLIACSARGEPIPQLRRS